MKGGFLTTDFTDYTDFEEVCAKLVLIQKVTPNSASGFLRLS
jgi:hypothetical protein